MQSMQSKTINISYQLRTANNKNYKYDESLTLKIGMKRGTQVVVALKTHKNCRVTFRAFRVINCAPFFATTLTHIHRKQIPVTLLN